MVSEAGHGGMSEATEGHEVPNSSLVCATCGRGDAQLLKGGELLRQPCCIPLEYVQNMTNLRILDLQDT